MPKPIQHLVETIGQTPVLLGSGALSLGGATLSTGSLAIGIFALLATTGVLPNGLASLGLAGGIVFTAAGPVGFLTSAGFFAFMATQARTKPERRSSEEVADASGAGEVEEEKPAEQKSELEKFLDAFDDKFRELVNKSYYDSYDGDKFYIKTAPGNVVHVSIFAFQVGNDLIMGNGINGQESILTLKNMVHDDLHAAMMKRIQKTHPDAYISTERTSTRFVITLK